MQKYDIKWICESADIRYNRCVEFNKSLFVTKIFAMKGIKIELLGIAIILLGIAVTTNNFWGYVLGVLGFGVAVVG